LTEWRARLQQARVIVRGMAERLDDLADELPYSDAELASLWRGWRLLEREADRGPESLSALWQAMASDVRKGLLEAEDD
jgi:hypothetical protein